MIDQADDFQERAAIAEFDGGIPREWAEGLAKLCTMPRPTDIPVAKWQQVKNAAGRFADQWAIEAARLGWSVYEVFGCNTTAPANRYDARGLVFSIADVDVKVERLESTRAILRTRGGAVQIFQRKSTSAPVQRRLIWDDAPGGD